MAKRKAAPRKVARRKAVTTRRTVGRTASGAKKSAAPAKKKAAAKKSAKKTASARKKTTAPASKAKKSGLLGGLVKRAARAVGRVARVAAPIAKKASPSRKKTTAKARVATPPPRTAPALNRERRVIRDDDEDVVPSPPSSLDFDRSASAARSGRRELKERFDEHTETGPALTGGDVDADWESAYSVGDEAPGGDNPTPDQDLVDDIGRAVGVEYQDNEELKGDEKIAKRDRNRWELDPASSDDWDDR